MTKPDILDKDWPYLLEMMDSQEMQPHPYIFATYMVVDPFLSGMQNLWQLERDFFDTVEPWCQLVNRHVLGADAIIWAAKLLADNPAPRNK
jgi:hypothetical protein